MCADARGIPAWEHPDALQLVRRSHDTNPGGHRVNSWESLLRGAIESCRAKAAGRGVHRSRDAQAVALGGYPWRRSWNPCYPWRPCRPATRSLASRCPPLRSAASSAAPAGAAAAAAVGDGGRRRCLAGNPPVAGSGDAGRRDGRVGGRPAACCRVGRIGPVIHWAIRAGTRTTRCCCFRRDGRSSCRQGDRNGPCRPWNQRRSPWRL